MKYKIGDRVRFLNESGGGIITKIISPKMVHVTIDDGFDLPVLTSELLKIELDVPVSSPKLMFTQEHEASINALPQTEYEADERNVPLLNFSAKGTIAEGVYMAFVPEDQKWLITGLLDIYLVNNTAYELLYNLYLKNEDQILTGYDYGSISANSMVLLESIDREDIEKWTEGLAQVLFHSDKELPALSPGNAVFKIKPTRFYKETSYNDSAIIDEKSVLITLLPLSSIIPMMKKEFVKDEPAAEHVINQAKEIEPKHIIDKHRTSPREAVVDLHIGELVEDYSKMDNSEMLRKQINYFTSCLESGIANGLSKITFIHGVGTGVLKTAMKEILKDYDRLEYREASMKEFGYGAMDVVIH